MKKQLLKQNNVRIIEDNELKNKLKKELIYCKSSFKKEFEELYLYQEEYFCWINTKKDILDSMKTNSLEDEYLTNILKFSDSRNSFLVTKLKAFHSYISFVEESLSNFKSINDFIDIYSIDTKLRLMLTSLGMDMPTDIFGEAL